MNEREAKNELAINGSIDAALERLVFCVSGGSVDEQGMRAVLVGAMHEAVAVAYRLHAALASAPAATQGEVVAGCIAPAVKSLRRSASVILDMVAVVEKGAEKNPDLQSELPGYVGPMRAEAEHLMQAARVLESAPTPQATAPAGATQPVAAEHDASRLNFALQALVAAGHVSALRVQQALALYPGDGTPSQAPAGVEAAQHGQAWPATSTVLAYVNKLMNDVHCVRPKDGYTPEQEADLESLRRIAKRVGDDRYQLAAAQAQPAGQAGEDAARLDFLDEFRRQAGGGVSISGAEPVRQIIDAARAAQAATSAKSHPQEGRMP